MSSNPVSGNLFVIAAPSGAGKTSLVKALIERVPDIEISISHTTRSKRPGEIDHRDYFFVSRNQFEEMVETQAFLEYATVYGNHYGTSKEWVYNKLKDGIDVILEIDWQGARQIHTLFAHAILIFILPPSLDALEQRLLKREQDESKIIENRMILAQNELSHALEFDYLVVNDQFDQALEDLQHIVLAKRFSVKTQSQKLAPLLETLMKRQ